MEEEKKFTGTTSDAEAAEEVAPAEDVKTDSVDGEKILKKVLFCLCYIWGILFFLPILIYRNDEEAKLHANQGLALLLLAIGGNLLFGLLTLINPLRTVFTVIASVYSFLLLVLGIMGIINVVTGSDRKIPIISGFKLIK